MNISPVHIKEGFICQLTKLKYVLRGIVLVLKMRRRAGGAMQAEARRADFLPRCSSSKRDTPRLNLTQRLRKRL